MEGMNHQFLDEGNDDIFMDLAGQFRNEGYQEGLIKGLQEGIELGLELLFGASALTMFHTVECIQDAKKLQIFMDAMKRLRNMDELNEILKQI